GPAVGFSGTLTSQVIAGDTSNPFGGLTFVYTVSNDAVSFSDIIRVTINGYQGILTDVSWDPTSAGTAPSSMSRSSGPGSTVGFNFDVPVLAPGTFTRTLVIQTDAQQYTHATFQAIDGDVAQIQTFSPGVGNGVPEPASLTILGLGACGLLMRRRK